MPTIVYTYVCSFKKRVFREKFLAKHPPVFKEWFLQTFPDPTSW